MAMHVGQLGGRAQETTAIPSRPLACFAQLREKPGHPVGDTSLAARPPLETIDGRPIAGIEITTDQIVLRFEVVVEGLLRDTSLLGDRIHTHGMQALAVEKLVSGSNDLISREQAIPRHILHLKSGLNSRGANHRSGSYPTAPEAQYESILSSECTFHDIGADC